MDLKKFVESFFKKLECDLKWKEDILKVENVPKKFEAFYGKKSPYLFSFSEGSKTEESELIVSGCFLLKIISNFLDSKPKTTLLKIDLETDFEKEVNKNFKFNNCAIDHISNPSKFDFIWRFTFSTTFQYLNEKEKIIKTIYVHDGDVIDNFSVEGYNLVQGKKKEIEGVETQKQYLVAQEKLRSLLKEKTIEISTSLKISLEKELTRIEDHCNQRLNEILEETKRHEKKIVELKKRLDRFPEEQKEIDEKISKLEDQIFERKNSKEFFQIEKEKEFFMNDEKNKHSLEIKTGLMNTSIIYYPIYNLQVYLRKKGKLQRPIEIIFNILTNRMYPVFCDSCKKLTNKINICSSGHVICDNCVSHCETCGDEICGKCRTFNCSKCNKQICKSCALRCSKCGGYICRDHVRKDYLSGKPICPNCSKYCFVCNQSTEKEFFKTCSKCSGEVCPKCSRKEMVNGVEKNVCSRCSKGLDFLRD